MSSLTSFYFLNLFHDADLGEIVLEQGRCLGRGVQVIPERVCPPGNRSLVSLSGSSLVDTSVFLTPNSTQSTFCSYPRFASHLQFRLWFHLILLPSLTPPLVLSFSPYARSATSQYSHLHLSPSVFPTLRPLTKYCRHHSKKPNPGSENSKDKQTHQR